MAEQYTDWSPSMRGGVENPGARRKGEEPAEQDGSNIPWERAPATSHIWGWKWLPLRSSSFNRKFPGRLGRTNILYVRFKNKTGGVAAEYSYGFADEATGLSIVEALRSSPHPYAEVLRPRVVTAGVPYTRM